MNRKCKPAPPVTRRMFGWEPRSANREVRTAKYEPRSANREVRNAIESWAENREVRSTKCGGGRRNVNGGVRTAKREPLIMKPKSTSRPRYCCMYMLCAIIDDGIKLCGRTVAPIDVFLTHLEPLCPWNIGSNIACSCSHCNFTCTCNVVQVPSFNRELEAITIHIY